MATSNKNNYSMYPEKLQIVSKLSQDQKSP